MADFRAPPWTARRERSSLFLSSTNRGVWLADRKAPGILGSGLRRVAIFAIAFIIAFAVYYVLNTYVLSGL